jgi:3-methyladenine DNA glycosylase AlkC
VAKNGCNEKYLQYSLETLAYFTQFFSSEWPVRKFFNTFPEETFEFFRKQAKSKNYHIRRWVSEGSRPSLPWGEKIAFDYKKAANLLDELFFDETRYVTRSVANHLNDISKKDADFVYTTLKKWEKSGKQNNKEMDFIIKHSLRTLVKK